MNEAVEAVEALLEVEEGPSKEAAESRASKVEQKLSLYVDPAAPQLWPAFTPLSTRS